MRLGKQLAGLALAMALASVGYARVPQDSPKQDMKDAGHSTKNAAKDTARATNNAARRAGHKTKTTSKKAAHKSARKTRRGAAKVEQKTQPGAGAPGFPALNTTETPRLCDREHRIAGTAADGFPAGRSSTISLRYGMPALKPATRQRDSAAHGGP